MKVTEQYPGSSGDWLGKSPPFPSPAVASSISDTTRKPTNATLSGDGL